MRRYGKRHRPRRQWFPVEGQADDDEILPAGEDWAFVSDTLTISPANGNAIDVVGLTFDFPPEELAAGGGTPSLADWQGAAWQLSSIVGKLHFAIRQDGSAQLLSILQNVFLMGWFAVLEVDDTGTPRQSDLFVYDPLRASNIREPYIWRRSWMVGTKAIDNAANVIIYNGFPQGNHEYGSVMDGPHIESKSGRFIGQNERLFFGLSGVTMAAPGGGGFRPTKLPDTVSVDYILDYRLVGNLRKFTNRKNTAI